MLKKVLLILFIVDLLGFGVGFYVLQGLKDEFLGHRIIGFSLLGLILVIMPIFLYVRYKGKDLNKYLLTKENLDKMRDRSQGKI